MRYWKIVFGDTGAGNQKEPVFTGISDTMLILRDSADVHQLFVSGVCRCGHTANWKQHSLASLLENEMGVATSGRRLDNLKVL